MTIFHRYDELGRPLILRQLSFNGDNNQWIAVSEVTRVYNRAGWGYKPITYPSGHAVAYNYDTAGRLADGSQN